MDCVNFTREKKKLTCKLSPEWEKEASASVSLFLSLLEKLPFSLVKNIQAQTHYNHSKTRKETCVIY